MSEPNSRGGSTLRRRSLRTPNVQRCPLIAKGAAVGAAGSSLGVLGAQQLAGALVPTLMSATGTVIHGIGTLHASGGIAATAQALSAASVGLLLLL